MECHAGDHGLTGILNAWGAVQGRNLQIQVLGFA
jgi:hypothetical protein